MQFYSFLTITSVAAIASFAFYWTAITLAQTILEKHRSQSRYKNTEIILPLRLQAYERMCLFLERISPNNLIIRLSGNSETAIDFQQLLLQEIRQEYNHNLAQQVYMSNDAWDEIKKAMQEIVTLINTAASETEPHAPANDLSKKIFENVIQREMQPEVRALRLIKSEIQGDF